MSLHHALKAIDDLHNAVEQLAANLLPGSPMPYRSPTLTAEQREEADHQARAERLERVDLAPGDCPDPYRMDIAELLTDCLVVADHLAELVTAEAEQSLRLWAGSWSWGLPSLHARARSQMTDPRPYLALLKLLLPEVEDERPDLLEEVEQQTKAATARADTALGNVTDGQRLHALCFVCGGKSDRYPIGGDTTLRVRTLHDGEPVIVCEGGRCAPTSADCGTWWKGRPAWRVHEWDWLSDRLGRVA